MAIPVSLETKARGCIALLCLAPILIAGCERTQNTYADSPDGLNRTDTGSRSDIVPRSSKRRTVLTGPAALYYMYKTHLGASGKGIAGRYYLAGKGGVYYLDENAKRRPVTAPVRGIQLAPNEAAEITKEARRNGFAEVSGSVR